MSPDDHDIEVKVYVSMVASICAAYDAIKSVPDTQEYDDLAEAVHEAKVYLNKSYPDKYSI
jgi:hypothetical protein